MGISILARALPAAYGKALQNARKGGIDAATAGADGVASSAGGMFAKNRIKRDEAMMVLNLVEDKGGKVVEAEIVQKQFDKYFAANSVEQGGSFYLQSKIYRAKELLDEYIKEKRLEEKEANEKQQTTQEKQ